MKVNELAEAMDLRPLALSDGEREIDGCYVGDLLSWVMGRAQSGQAWVTIMTNINVVAVAALTDVACVILAEGSAPEADVIARAERQGINLLQSEKASYELCVGVHRAAGV